MSETGTCEQDAREELRWLPAGQGVSSPSPERWHCELCGCKVERVALDGVSWGHMPKFCPNCGEPFIRPELRRVYKGPACKVV